MASGSESNDKGKPAQENGAGDSRHTPTKKALPASPLPALPEPTDEQVDATVQRLRDLQDKVKLDLVVNVGRVVVKGLYGGDLDALRSRDQKMHSLRKLAAHPDLPFSATTLYYSVGVYELTERLGGVHAREHLTATHYRAMLGLPHTDQESLLDKAQQERWPTRTLEEEAARLRARAHRGGGRPPLRGVVKSVGALHRLVEARKDDLFDLGDADTMAPEEAHELFNRVMDVTAELDRLKEKLRPLMDQSRTIAVEAGGGKGKTAKGASRVQTRA
jgi:hypothetical protein